MAKALNLADFASRKKKLTSYEDWLRGKTGVKTIATYRHYETGRISRELHIWQGIDEKRALRLAREEAKGKILSDPDFAAEWELQSVQLAEAAR